MSARTSSGPESQGGADVEAGEQDSLETDIKAPLEETANSCVLQNGLSTKWYGLICIEHTN